MREIENRGFLLVSPKKALLEWVKKIENDSGFPESLYSESKSEYKAIYFIKPLDFVNSETIRLEVEKVYKQIFKKELQNWQEDESLWPKELTIELFYDWFNVEYIDEGYDLCIEQTKKH